jgi:radical SAM/Cys-rich protein
MNISGQERTAEFLADHQVTVVASLPCYSPKNVNLQRGAGVFQKSILALLKLNDLGYGKEEGLKLHLVYNPLGAFLPPDQSHLEIKYREELWEAFGIKFNQLYAMTNMPIKRFADFLYRR